MFLNYIKLSLRLLVRNPFFTLINVLGLAVGFAVFFILWPFTQSELKADEFITDHERISRVIFDWNWLESDGATWGHVLLGSVPSHVGPELYNDGYLESFTRYLPQTIFSPKVTPGLKANLIVSIDQDGKTLMYSEEQAICGDSNIFEFFDLPFVAGDRSTALINSGSVAISETMAIKFFGSTDVVSRMIRVNGNPYIVTGIFNDIPKNSHLEFDMVFSNAGQNWWRTGGTDGEFVYQYLKQRDSGIDLNIILDQHKEKLVNDYVRNAPHVRAFYRNQPLDEIAYSQNYAGDTFHSKSKFTLRILAGVSVLVLIMAWMNYLNLTISRTRTRFKEIAARKMSGALVRDLFTLFFCQATVINVIAIGVGATFVQLLKLPFDHFFHVRSIPLSEMELTTIVLFTSMFVAGILITSAYAVMASVRFTTSQLIRQGQLQQKNALPSVLTTAQYTIAFVLITLMIVSHSQLEFIMSRDLGLDKESVVLIDGPIVGVESNRVSKMQEFVHEVESSVGLKASLSVRAIGDVGIYLDGKRLGSTEQAGWDSHGGVDENFVSVYGLKILAGRNFQSNEKRNSILLSKFAAEKLGFRSPSEAIGSKLDLLFLGDSIVDVVGVFADYRVLPLLRSSGSSEDVTGRGEALTYLDKIIPAMIPEKISIKLGDGAPLEAIEKVEKIYNELFPGNAFTWRFLTDNINRHYKDQQVTRNQVSFFTLLALGVACLGLLGMIANKIVDKTKEVCIRKIIGATHFHVIVLLVKSTIKQVLISVAMGIPIAWYLSSSYLSRFTDQIELQWWYYLVPMGIMLALMFSTIASVIWKALVTNPVAALKHE